MEKKRIKVTCNEFIKLFEESKPLPNIFELLKQYDIVDWDDNRRLAYGMGIPEQSSIYDVSDMD